MSRRYPIESLISLVSCLSSGGCGLRCFGGGAAGLARQLIQAQVTLLGRGVVCLAYFGDLLQVGLNQRPLRQLVTAKAATSHQSPVTSSRAMAHTSMRRHQRRATNSHTPLYITGHLRVGRVDARPPRCEVLRVL